MLLELSPTVEEEVLYIPLPIIKSTFQLFLILTLILALHSSASPLDSEEGITFLHTSSEGSLDSMINNNYNNNKSSPEEGNIDIMDDDDEDEDDDDSDSGESVEKAVANGTKVRRKNLTMDEIIEKEMADNPLRDPLYIAIPMTLIYSLILLSGLVGNISTCIVIARTSYMHTATNYYLFSLAMSDLLLLISGLPQEIYHIWIKYPYGFGEAFCVIRGLAAETSANATVLTITAFTVERFVAIVYPLKSHKLSQLSRVIRMIGIIWLVAFCLALPQAAQFGVQDHVSRDYPQIVVIKGAWCTLVREIFPYAFQISICVFFAIPMTVISVLYILIGLRLRQARKGPLNSEPRMRQRHAQSHVVRMLVAVVVAFFICWAPFHAQRLMALYGSSQRPASPVFIMVYQGLTHVSGILYYLSTCINPILYHIMSNKFRQAFTDTMARVCGMRRGAFHRGSTHSTRGQFTYSHSRTYSVISQHPSTRRTSSRVITEGLGNGHQNNHHHYFSNSAHYNDRNRNSRRLDMNSMKLEPLKNSVLIEEIIPIVEKGGPILDSAIPGESCGGGESSRKTSSAAVAMAMMATKMGLSSSSSEPKPCNCSHPHRKIMSKSTTSILTRNSKIVTKTTCSFCGGYTTTTSSNPKKPKNAKKGRKGVTFGFLSSHNSQPKEDDQRKERVPGRRLTPISSCSEKETGEDIQEVLNAKIFNNEDDEEKVQKGKDEIEEESSTSSHKVKANGNPTTTTSNLNNSEYQNVSNGNGIRRHSYLHIHHPTSPIFFEKKTTNGLGLGPKNGKNKPSLKAFLTRGKSRESSVKKASTTTFLMLSSPFCSRPRPLAELKKKSIDGESSTNAKPPMPLHKNESYTSVGSARSNTISNSSLQDLDDDGDVEYTSEELAGYMAEINSSLDGTKTVLI